MTEKQSTAAIVIIGDEILSGSVVDENSPFLIKQLAKQDVCVQICVTIPDNLTVIAHTISECCKKYDWVFTAGGIGPTHDDITIEGIANAFAVELFQHEELADLIKSAYGDKFRDEHLKMALVPKDIRLLFSKNSRFPALSYKNIIILPGVPEFLKAVFMSIRGHFKGQHIYSKTIKVNFEEVEFADLLKNVIKKFEGLKIGSYPVLRNDEYRVRLILKHENETVLSSSAAFLEHELGLIKH